VSDACEQRISESQFEAEAGVALSLKKLLKLDANETLLHCNCNAANNCLNISVCAASTGVGAFSVVAWNPLARRYLTHPFYYYNSA
jgi:alpha-mannosidase